MAIISTNNINKYYGRKKVIENLKFDIKQNEFTALIGNNGVGKTTTLKIICNLTDFTGELYINDKRIEPRDYIYRKDFGIIFDENVLISEFTVNEYFRFLSKIYCIESHFSRINELMYLFDIQYESNSQIMTLSSGNRMKILFIASLMHNPSVLIFDEPFINIDIKTTELFVEILKSFSRKKTLLITSHNLDLVVDICDRFLIMELGQIILDFRKTDYGSKDELKNKVKSKLIDKKTLKDFSWLNNFTNPV